MVFMSSRLNQVWLVVASLTFYHFTFSRLCRRINCGSFMTTHTTICRDSVVGSIMIPSWRPARRRHLHARQRKNKILNAMALPEALPKVAGLFLVPSRTFSSHRRRIRSDQSWLLRIDLQDEGTCTCGSGKIKYWLQWLRRRRCPKSSDSFWSLLPIIFLAILPVADASSIFQDAFELSRQYLPHRDVLSLLWSVSTLYRPPVVKELSDH